MPESLKLSPHFPTFRRITAYFDQIHLVAQDARTGHWFKTSSDHQDGEWMWEWERFQFTT